MASEKDLDIRAYTKKIKEELSRLEDDYLSKYVKSFSGNNDCITDFLTINKDVGILYSELNNSNKILCKIENVVD